MSSAGATGPTWGSRARIPAPSSPACAMEHRRDLDARIRLAILYVDSPIVALRHHAPVGPLLRGAVGRGDLRGLAAHLGEGVGAVAGRRQPAAGPEPDQPGAGATRRCPACRRWCRQSPADRWVRVGCCVTSGMMWPGLSMARRGGAWRERRGRQLARPTSPTFHRDRAGVIEAVLSRALAGDHSPYRWLARAVSATANVVLGSGLRIRGDVAGAGPAGAYGGRPRPAPSTSWPWRPSVAPGRGSGPTRCGCRSGTARSTW